MRSPRRPPIRCRLVCMGTAIAIALQVLRRHLHEESSSLMHFGSVRLVAIVAVFAAAPAGCSSCKKPAPLEVDAAAPTVSAAPPADAEAPKVEEAADAATLAVTPPPATAADAGAKPAPTSGPFAGSYRCMNGLNVAERHARLRIVEELDRKREHVFLHRGGGDVQRHRDVRLDGQGSCEARKADRVHVLAAEWRGRPHLQERGRRHDDQLQAELNPRPSRRGPTCWG